MQDSPHENNKRFCHWNLHFFTSYSADMANFANFVSILIAKNALANIFFVIISLNLVLNCVAKERNFGGVEKEFQNGEDNIEIFANKFENSNQEDKFGQLKNRVVVVNGKTVVGGDGKTHYRNC